ncbi:MAG: kelch repeat-containing protein [Planctomycetota bacterium]
MPRMHKTLFIITLLITIFITDAIIAKERESETESQMEGGGTAPVFEVDDYKGNIVKLSDFKGMVLIIHHLSPGCPTCNLQIATTNAMRKKFGRENLKVIAFIFDGTFNDDTDRKANRERIRQVIGGKSAEGAAIPTMDFDYYIVWSSAIYSKQLAPLRFKNEPLLTCIIDKGGNFVYRGTDKEVSKDKMEKYLSQAIKAESGKKDKPEKKASDMRIEKLSVTLPVGRFATSAVWDQVNKCAYVFGGSHASGQYLNEIVRYNPAKNEVTKLPAVLPGPRGYSSAIWDTEKKCAYIFGGGMCDQIIKYNPSGNAVNVLANLPKPTAYSAAVWDPTNKCAYIFGGLYEGTIYLDKVVRYIPQKNQVKAVATLPAPLAYNCAVWDTDNKCAYIFGGVDGKNVPSLNVLKYDPDGNKITELPLSIPSDRTYSSAVWDQDNKCAYIFGGLSDGRIVLSDILKYDPYTKSIEKLDITLPSGRWGTSAVWDQHNKCAYVFGGDSGRMHDDIIKIIFP